MAEEEGCELCQLSVGVGMALNVCGDIKGVDCEKLYESIESGERTPDEVVDMLIDKAPKRGDARKMLVEVKELMHLPYEDL